jgi:hypothetical protein
MGIPLDEMVIWNPDLEQGGLTREQIVQGKDHPLARLLFSAPDVPAARHHQVPQPVPRWHRHFAPRMQLRSLQAVRLHRQHRIILQTVKAAPPNTRWLVGTEFNLVERLARGSEARRQDRAVHGQHDLHVLDHAAHRSAAPGLDTGKSGRRQGGQSNQGARTRSRAGQDRAGTHAGRLVSAALLLK